ncbi:YcjX family GTP-binding protein [Alkalimarinus alittae]|uniref:YcjX family protein n=1 Tax=Alkalimarinus alittae TaxID=2961619 RepID=A0ABY6MY83_9ALTE|nr:YcjX family protein [Alkalimarinus alittae]UZE94794.1 YcjX family protein [Alkalimarinus alittae]
MNQSKDKTAQFFQGAYKKMAKLTDEGLASMDKLRDRRFCIGITGLSQSGKSTFITSLINQLQQYKTSSLPGFSPVLTERLLNVKVHPLEDVALTQFPYDEAYKRLTNPDPQWPIPTKDISGCLLELRLAKKVSKLNPFGRDQFSLFLEIRDYPGEWLLDLPLLETSYLRWSAQCNTQYTQRPRSELLGELLHDLQHIDPLAEVDEAHLIELNKRFLEFLHDCKYKGKGLSLIQPGRFLIPGGVEDPSILCFLPLLKSGNYTEGQLAAASENSYFKVCERRYKRYIKELVKPFYKKFFSRIDRQLVLVDVVNALNAGPEYIDDMRHALTNITDSFAYGSQNRFLQLFKPKIDKVVFAATKIDQVVSEDHEAVRQLLAVLVSQAYKNAQHEGVHPTCEATAAVRSSKEIDHAGERGITGLGSDGSPIGYTHPTIPSRIPEGRDWQPFIDWKIPVLKPPKGLSYQNSDAIPHIRLDTVLNILIGDKCV